MRTNDMKLETFETFVVKLACGFASLVLLLMLMGLMLVAGFAGSTSVSGITTKNVLVPEGSH